MSRKLTEAKKKSIASQQDFQCANKPGANLPGIEDYKCLLWARNDPTKLGNFDGAGYEIDHIKEFCDSKDDSDSNLQALCCSCHSVKTRNYMMNKKYKSRKNKSHDKYDSDDNDDSDDNNDSDDNDDSDDIKNVNNKDIIDGLKNKKSATSKKIISKKTTSEKIITETIYSESIEKSSEVSNEESTSESIDIYDESLEDFASNQVFMKILTEYSTLKIPKKFIRDFSIIGNKYYNNKPCIDIGILILWLDVRKDHIKEALLKFFSKKQDYIIHKRKKKGPGLPYVEDITISSNCCKKLCMKFRGKKVENMLEYFMALEFSFKKYHKYIQEEKLKNSSNKSKK